MKDAPWVGNPPEPEYSGLKDYEGEPIFEGEQCKELDGYIIPVDKWYDFIDYLIKNYPEEAKEYIDDSARDYARLFTA